MSGDLFKLPARDVAYCLMALYKPNVRDKARVMALRTALYDWSGLTVSAFSTIWRNPPFAEKLAKCGQFGLMWTIGRHDSDDAYETSPINQAMAYNAVGSGRIAQSTLPWPEGRERGEIEVRWGTDAFSCRLSVHNGNNITRRRNEAPSSGKLTCNLSLTVTASRLEWGEVHAVCVERTAADTRHWHCPAQPCPAYLCWSAADFDRH